MKRLAGLAAACALVGAAPAGAAVTQTKITAPGDPSETIFPVPGPQILHVAGTATGSGTVRVYCVNGVKAVALTGNLTVSSGTFSADVDFATRTASLCRLRAYPDAPTPPSDLQNFTGPAVKVGREGPVKVTSGPNAGGTSAFERTDPRFGGTWDLYSARCAVGGGELTSTSDFARTRTLWLCAASLDSSVPGLSRSGLRVDGRDAFAASDAYESNPGWLPIAVTFASDSQTATVTTTEPLLRCADATYPPDDTRCATQVDTGVRLERTITETLDGAAIDVVDTFASTGAAHALDLIYDEAAGDGTVNHIGWRFPGEAGYQLREAGDVRTVAAGRPLTIRLASDVTKVDDPSQTAGTLTVSPAPASVRFAAEAEPVIPMALTVPAGGRSAAVLHSFRVGATEAAVAPLAQAAEDRQSPPVVTITAPAPDAHVPAGSDLALRGTATDNVGVASLTVAGTNVTPAPDGTFSRTVTVLPGANTFTVAARDATGGSAGATVRVIGDLPVAAVPTASPSPTVVPVLTCKVPKLHRLTPKQARRRLAGAHCRLASKQRRRVTRRRRLRKRVVAQSVRPGSVRPAGTAVTITLGKRPRRT